MTEKNFTETIKNKSKPRAWQFPRSEFSWKFLQHFGLTAYEDKRLMDTEKHWYFRHDGKCRWEL